MSRRDFLTLPIALLLVPATPVAAEIHRRRGSYAAEVGILYDLLTLRIAGAIEESVDSAGRRYDVRVVGSGSSIANLVESTGRVLEGRWAPVRTAAWFQIRGRESRSEIVYDHVERKIDYRFRGETFFLRRLRVVDDTIPIPSGAHVDDLISAMLNYADNRWPFSTDGTLSTHVVRRRKRDDEGPDDVEQHGHAELVPFQLKINRDPTSGKPTALFDMTPFSSWARRGTPARIVFGGNRRPELITSSLILGTSVTIRVYEV